MFSPENNSPHDQFKNIKEGVQFKALPLCFLIFLYSNLFSISILDIRIYLVMLVSRISIHMIPRGFLFPVPFRPCKVPDPRWDMPGPDCHSGPFPGGAAA
jgi:hypothetical protein